MFSGIIETSAPVLESQASSNGDVVRIRLAKPNFFDDLKTGDSICTNGVCLTLEDFDSKSMQFALGRETLNITGWNEKSLLGRTLNLERSLKFGDRVHGHFVTGHVDGVGEVVKLDDPSAEYMEVQVRFPEALKGFFWKKGSVCLDGVSLTVNEVSDSILKVGLIPETLKLTNLKNLKNQQRVNLEVDFMSRALVNYFSERLPPHAASLR